VTLVKVAGLVLWCSIQKTIETWWWVRCITRSSSRLILWQV